MYHWPAPSHVITANARGQPHVQVQIYEPLLPGQFTIFAINREEGEDSMRAALSLPASGMFPKERPKAGAREQ